MKKQKNQKKRKCLSSFHPIPSSFLTSHHTLSLPSHGLICGIEKRGWGLFYLARAAHITTTTTGGEKTHNTETEKGVEGTYWEDNSTLSGDYSLAEDMSVYVCTEE